MMGIKWKDYCLRDNQCVVLFRLRVRSAIIIMWNMCDLLSVSHSHIRIHTHSHTYIWIFNFAFNSIDSLIKMITCCCIKSINIHNCMKTLAGKISKKITRVNAQNMLCVYVYVYERLPPAHTNDHVRILQPIRSYACIHSFIIDALILNPMWIAMLPCIHLLFRHTLHAMWTVISSSILCGQSSAYDYTVSYLVLLQ